MFDVRQEITAGNTLVREAVQSQNFVSGSAGWQLKANGDAELNNLVVRGSGVFGPDPGRHIDINVTYAGRMGIYTGNVNENDPGRLEGGFSAPSIALYSPTYAPFNNSSLILLEPKSDGTTYLQLQADKIEVTTPLKLFNESQWFPMTLLYVNSWVDVAGARGSYLKDASGGVFLRGQVSGGVATTICTLPVGYRPSQSVQFAQRAGAGAGVTAAFTVQTNGDVVVTTNLAQATTLLRLECYFSTL